jgi:hypothetical protein
MVLTIVTIGDVTNGILHEHMQYENGADIVRLGAVIRVWTAQRFCVLWYSKL